MAKMATPRRGAVLSAFTMPPPLSNLMRRPWTDWLLLVEATCSLLAARWRLLFCSFEQIAHTLGHEEAETLRTCTPEMSSLGKRIGWAVKAVARHSPLPLVCLPQAMAAQRMLARRRVSSTLYLGIRLRAAIAEPLAAHAWLRLGPWLITGRPSRVARFPIASFAWVRSRGLPAWKWLRRGTVFLGVVALASCSLVPIPPLRLVSWHQFPAFLQPAVQWLGGQDFWSNVLGVGAINLLVHTLMFGRYRAEPMRRMRLIALMFALVVALECAQLFMPGRAFDLWDMVAGAVGLLLTSWPWVRFRPL